tara:strand:+ start:125 stop:418 length:294 start_codon:yes stop_codon:yes gene_type:complete
MQLDKLLNNACKIILELESLIQKHRVDELLDYNMDKKIDKFFKEYLKGKDVNNLNKKGISVAKKQETNNFCGDCGKSEHAHLQGAGATHCDNFTEVV